METNEKRGSGKDVQKTFFIFRAWLSSHTRNNSAEDETIGRDNDIKKLHKKSGIQSQNSSNKEGEEGKKKS